MARTSIKAAVRDAKAEDKRERKRYAGSFLNAATDDSFINFAQKLGIGADNALTSGTYGYNPITRNRVLLEWIHRGSWLGGVAIDLIADDMTRAGVDFTCEMPPEDSEAIESEMTNLGFWEGTNEVVAWSRLYGGSVGVHLIDGQDMKTPLRLETVGKGQYKGILALDRWQIEPSLEDLVTDFGPYLGTPKYYRVLANAPALRGMTIHYSRLAYRMVGIKLPYQQRLTENLWGISILERLYDRLLSFDSATTGAAQLVYKAYLRTLKIDGLREIVAAGGQPMNGLMQYTEIMRRFQGMEGITLLDKEDEFDVQQHGAFSGLSDALVQFGQQLSGALQIPLVRLFGQSPAGLNASGDSDLRTYYDGINQKQNKEMHLGVTAGYKLCAQSLGINIPDNFGVAFAPLWQLSDKEKADIASSVGSTVSNAMEQGIIGRRTAMKELRQNSKTTGIFTNITQDAIEEADDEIAPPGGDESLGGPPMPGSEGLGGSDLNDPSEDTPANSLPGDVNEETRPNGKEGPMAGSTPRRKLIQHEAAPGGQAGGNDRKGVRPRRSSYEI